MRSDGPSGTTVEATGCDSPVQSSCQRTKVAVLMFPGGKRVEMTSSRVPFGVVLEEKSPEDGNAIALVETEL